MANPVQELKSKFEQPSEKQQALLGEIAAAQTNPQTEASPLTRKVQPEAKVEPSTQAARAEPKAASASAPPAGGAPGDRQALTQAALNSSGSLADLAKLEQMIDPD